MMKRIAAFILAMASATAWAQWMDQSGKALPDEPFRKTVDGMGAMLVLTSKYNDFIKEWTGTDDKHSPLLKPVSELKHGDDATILVFFSGCAKPGQPCNLTADIKVIAPNGSVYGEFKDRPAFDATIDKEGTVMLSHAMIQMRIEPNDAVGEYKVLVTLHRPSTKTSIELEQRLRVVQ